MDNAFNYIHDNGICLEKDYPYTASDGSCNTTCKSITKIKSFIDITPNSESVLLKAVTIQPISVAIEADQSSFQFYSSGVLTSTCGKSLDHGVLVVGYGTLNGVDYWKVKNSWGESWGDKGYILLERNVKDKAGQCGITLMASYPIISKV
jgi:C1A family cysteine protease